MDFATPLIPMWADQLLLEVTDLRVVFNVDDREVTVVDGVSFDLRRGKTLALVGESGCGKSVTAWSMLRLIQEPGRIASGRVRLRPYDEAPIDVLELSRNSSDLYRLRGGLVSMIFQEPQAALSPVHSIGAQLVEAICLHRKLSRRDAQSLAAEMLGRLGVQNPLQRMQQYSHEFSGGMRQRVMIAIALITRPQLLIADEPTTALNEHLRAKTQELFQEMQVDTGMSVLLITHDLATLASTAHHVAVMYCGQIVELGTVEEVTKAPLHPYTKGLLSSAELDPSQLPKQRLRTIDGAVPVPGRWPRGCRFHNRCPDAIAGVCNTGQPPRNTKVAGGRSVACFLVNPNG
jgi:peptide/nickel transport system ATP-binding protein